MCVKDQDFLIQMLLVLNANHKPLKPFTMFTIDEYFKVKNDSLFLEIELINLRSAFKLIYDQMDDVQKKEAESYLNLFSVSEKTKSYIYDSRTTESGKTEAEPNTETIG